MPDELKPVLARQMEVYAGFLEHTDHHVGRLVDALEDLGVLDDTLVYYIIGDNGASAEGTRQRHVQRDVHLQRRRRARDAGVHGLEDRRVRHARGLQPLRRRLGARDGHAVPVDEAGRLALGRHAQRHDRALAERLQGEGRDPLPVPPRDRRRPDRPRGRRAARADVRSTASSRSRSRASAWPTRSTTRTRPERHETQYFEMFCNRGIYHEGWTAVTRHRTPWVMAAAAAVRRRRLGALRHEHRLDPGARPRRRACRRSSPSCSGSSSSRRRSTTCCRSTTGASSASTRTSPAGRSSSRATRSCSSAAWAG